MKTVIIAFIVLMSIQIQLNAQKIITDCTISYTVSATKKNPNAEPGKIDMYNGTIINLFIKGNNSRMETSTPFGNFVFIYDSKLGTGVKLKENGANKFIENFSKEKIDAENKKFEGATFKEGAATKQIASYNCKEGLVTLKSGSTIKVFYTTDIQPQNKKFDFQFEIVPGFVLEYIRENEDATITTTATKCSLTPVPQSKFEAPKSGYREIGNN